MLIERVRRKVGKSLKEAGKKVVKVSALRSSTEGMVVGAGIYGAGKVVEGRKN